MSQKKNSKINKKKIKKFLPPKFQNPGGCTPWVFNLKKFANIRHIYFLAKVYWFIV